MGAVPHGAEHMNVGGCVACREGKGVTARFVSSCSIAFLEKSSGDPFFFLAMLGLLLLSGCAGGPKVILPELQGTIDRKLVEYPAETEFRPYIEGLTAPT